MKTPELKEQTFEEALEEKRGTSILLKLSRVKSEIGTLSKNAKNPFFKSNYLDLNGILSALEPLLNEHGLLLTQPIIDGCVRTEITDIDTMEVMRSEMKLPTITDPQKLGSAITYFRRYTLQSLLALQAVDDDGNEAAKPVKPVMNEDMFNGYLSAVALGNHKMSKEEVKAKFNLTVEQLKQLV